jgi:membrane associated rhomboid family serine protease
LTEDQDTWLVLASAFIPGRYSALGTELPGAPWALVTSFITYALLHADLVHLVVNSAWLLAMGTVVARRTGTVRFLGLSAVCGIAGALAFLVGNPGRMVPMIGASGAISGMMGAVFRLMFAVRDARGRILLAEHPEAVPRLSVGEIFSDRRALGAITIWVAVNALLATGVMDLAEPGVVAWEAHLGGFFAGLLLFGLFDRPPLPGQYEESASEPPVAP